MKSIIFINGTEFKIGKGRAALKSIIFTMRPVKNTSGRSAKGKLGTIRTGRLALMVGVQQCNNLRTKYVPYVILNTIRATNPFSRVDFDNFKPSPNHTKLHINGELGPRL